jgi:L-seryl-tRNA(Ser) seleniumtransferase
MDQDPRRGVPRTDTLLADPRLVAALERHPRLVVKHAVGLAQERCRTGAIAPEAVVEEALRALPGPPVPVINATGVVLHTNLGRAPLARSAVDALVAAAGYSDVELDLATGRRDRRGRSVEELLRLHVPEAEAALVVNNGAAALVLAALVVGAGSALAVSRGELVEIGDGFRLMTVLESAGVRLHEVGATNRTTLADYRGALGTDARAVLKVHSSNFTVTGFTESVDVSALAGLGVPVVVDLGSGLLQPDPLLPAEPDAATTLRAGAAVVTASADKLLGGPQAGLILGRADLVERMRRHPMARTFRVDKLTLAALGATLSAATTPVRDLLAAADHVERASAMAARIPGAEVVETSVPVGGGSGPGVELPSAAVAVPESWSVPLRTGNPVVVGRVHDGRLLLDLRAVPRLDDEALLAAVLAVARS